MAKLQPVRGTHDLIGQEQRKFSYIRGVAKEIAARYGFSQWETPIFEQTRVFAHSLGDTSDVVCREMYSFDDRDGESLTLRPEGTAAICRAMVSNSLMQSLPQKVFYTGPMFRYERPQKGRYRQFHQIGAELLGTDSPFSDAEMMTLAWQILQQLNISGDITLEINTLGDDQSRQAWRHALIEYFTAHKDNLSEDSQNRLERNPLRILDSKDPQDKDIAQNAPQIFSFLSDEAKRHWEDVQKYLKGFSTPFKVNPNIVRGLDYYNYTTFEFTTNALGAQGTVLAGGRYNGLTEKMGGKDIPAIGWAAGLERLAMLTDDVKSKTKIINVIPAGQVSEETICRILSTLRRENMTTEIDYSGSPRKRMERANKKHVDYVIFAGEEELAQGEVTLRHMKDGKSERIKLCDLLASPHKVL